MTPREDYLAAVRANVPAWSFRRAGLLREIRDGIDDATIGYLDEGLDSVAAQRSAVAEFGPAHQVAASIRTELAVDAGRIAALVAGVGSGAQVFIAEMIWSTGTSDDWFARPGWYGALAQVVDVAGIVVLVAGVGMAIALGRSPRLLGFARRFDRVRAARAAAIAVMISVVLQSAAGIALMVFGPGATALFTMAPLEMVHSPTLPIIEVVLAAQCLRLASGRGARKQNGPHHTAERLPFTPT